MVSATPEKVHDTQEKRDCVGRFRLFALFATNGQRRLDTPIQGRDAASVARRR
jgi:hypothetical protein